MGCLVPLQEDDFRTYFPKLSFLVICLVFVLSLHEQELIEWRAQGNFVA